MRAKIQAGSKLQLEKHDFLCISEVLQLKEVVPDKNIQISLVLIVAMFSNEMEMYFWVC